MTNAVADIEQETPEIEKERQLAGVGAGAGTVANGKKKPHDHALASILGPAFVAAVAYVDPGNVAANITSGARYGYLLVWVLVLANASKAFALERARRHGIPAEFISKILSKITLIGAIFLAFVAILPILYSNLTGMYGLSMGGTSVIIVVGVALETVKSLEAQMLMRHYKGFLE